MTLTEREQRERESNDNMKSFRLQHPDRIQMETRWKQSAGNNQKQNMMIVNGSENRTMKCDHKTHPNVNQQREHNRLYILNSSVL